MNVFNSLMVYAGKWILKSKRNFAAEEIAAVSKAEVVTSQYGNSVCFHMVGGGQTFIPLSNDSNLSIGETIDLSKAELLTLEKDGQSDIIRVKA